MEAKTWMCLVDTYRDIRAAAGQDAGGVVIPTLLAFRAGQQLGYVHLRSVDVGGDAREGVEMMGLLAAESGADEVVAVWEAGELAAACDHSPYPPGRALSFLWTNSVSRMLVRYPYRPVLLPGIAPDGLPSVLVDWLPPESPEYDNDVHLEPAITAMISWCWQPMTVGQPAGLDAAIHDLVERGYRAGMCPSR